MTRSETTAFLSDLLVSSRLAAMGKYYASEVTLDFGSENNIRRIDFLEFRPAGVQSVSGIEKGEFVVYEIKSCKEDYNSGFGQNFIGEQNYLVMPMETYKAVCADIEYPIGVMCPVPEGRKDIDEFEDPTPLDKEGVTWRLHIIRSCGPKIRNRSLTELLFCMLRSGR